MNRGLEEVGGQLLVVSQFTLYGNCRHGRRPDFLAAARPETAVPLYEQFIAFCREKGFSVETGVFGADMYPNLNLPASYAPPSTPDRSSWVRMSWRFLRASTH